jgi:hypothetical protein
MVLRRGVKDSPTPKNSVPKEGSTGTLINNQSTLPTTLPITDIIQPSSIDYPHLPSPTPIDHPLPSAATPVSKPLLEKTKEIEKTSARDQIKSDAIKQAADHKAKSSLNPDPSLDNSVPKDKQQVPTTSLPNQGIVPKIPRDNSDIKSAVKASLHPVTSIDKSLQSNPSNSSMSDQSNFTLSDSSIPTPSPTSTSKVNQTNQSNDVSTLSDTVSESSSSSLLGKVWDFFKGTTNATNVPITSITPLPDQDIINESLKLGIVRYEDTKEYPKSGGLKVTPEGYNLYRKSNTLELRPLEEEELKTKLVFEVGLLKISNNTIIPISSQTHLVVVHDYKTNSVRAIGILTSQDSKDTSLLSEKQELSGNDDKGQSFRAFDVPYDVNSSEFELHPEGTNYVQKAEISKKLEDICENKLNNATVTPYNSNGILNEDLLKIVALKKQDIENAKALEASKKTNFMTDEKEQKAALKKKKAEFNSQQQKAKAKEEKLDKATQTQQTVDKSTDEETSN